jgi:hypothetical protein
MVKLEEVLDEEFGKEQVGPEGDEDWDTDSGRSPFFHHPPTSTVVLC